MTPRQYRIERRRRGTPKSVSEQTGEHVTTIQRRERGEIPITRAAELLLLSLPKLKRMVPEHVRGRKPESLSKKQLAS